MARLADYSLATIELLIDAAYQQVESGQTLWIALSGGCDSTTLLYLTYRAQQRNATKLVKLKALHVHHGYHLQADIFADFCQSLCHSLAIPLTIEYYVSQAESHSETKARQARYWFFAQHLQAKDVIWLAHHQDDQIETFWLRALRGSGVTGLAAIPKKRSLGQGWLLRPLLSVPRIVLKQLAQAQHWYWCEDNTNADSRYTFRNTIRHEIWPLLTELKTATASGLIATIHQLQNARDLLVQYAQQDLLTCGKAEQLRCNQLIALGQLRAAAVIRLASVQLDLAPIPAKRLQTIWQQLASRNDGQQTIRWSNSVAYIWRQQLYLQRYQVKLMDSQWQVKARFYQKKYLFYNGSQRLTTTLQRRCGGEKMYYRSQHRNLKAILQLLNIPFWQRQDLWLVINQTSQQLIAAILAEQIIVADEHSYRYLH